MSILGIDVPLVGVGESKFAHCEFTLVSAVYSAYIGKHDYNSR